MGIELEAQGDRGIILFSFTLPRALSLLHQKDKQFIRIENIRANKCNRKHVVDHSFFFSLQIMVQRDLSSPMKSVLVLDVQSIL